MRSSRLSLEKRFKTLADTSLSLAQRNLILPVLQVCNLLLATKRHLLIVMISRLHVLGAFQFAHQLCRIMNQYWEVLRADPELPLLVFECDKGNFCRISPTGEALGNVCFTVHSLRVLSKKSKKSKRVSEHVSPLLAHLQFEDKTKIRRMNYRYD